MHGGPTDKPASAHTTAAERLACVHGAPSKNQHACVLQLLRDKSACMAGLLKKEHDGRPACMHIMTIEKY
jgi:hypothetical protein